MKLTAAAALVPLLLLAPSVAQEGKQQQFQQPTNSLRGRLLADTDSSSARRCGEVTGFSLYNPDTGAISVLEDDSVIVLDDYTDSKINIIANTEQEGDSSSACQQQRCVKLSFAGTTRKERVVPYTLYGDIQPNFDSGTPATDSSRRQLLEAWTYTDHDCTQGESGYKSQSILVLQSRANGRPVSAPTPTAATRAPAFSPAAPPAAPPAETPVQQGPNDPCYICLDGGASTITLPDAVVPIPAEFQDEIPLATLTCWQFLNFAQVVGVVPSDRCPALLAIPNLQAACGCENVIGAPPVDPPTEPPAEPPVQQGANGPCYICLDGGASTITLLDAVIPIPSQFQVDIAYPMLTCSQLLDIAEGVLGLPSDRCPALLALPNLQAACGCENVVRAPVDPPTATPVVGAPTRAPVQPPEVETIVATPFTLTCLSTSGPASEVHSAEAAAITCDRIADGIQLLYAFRNSISLVSTDCVPTVHANGFPLNIYIEVSFVFSKTFDPEESYAGVLSGDIPSQLQVDGSLEDVFLNQDVLLPFLQDVLLDFAALPNFKPPYSNPFATTKGFEFKAVSTRAPVQPEVLTFVATPFTLTYLSTVGPASEMDSAEATAITCDRIADGIQLLYAFRNSITLVSTDCVPTVSANSTPLHIDIEVSFVFSKTFDPEESYAGVLSGDIPSRLQVDGSLEDVFLKQDVLLPFIQDVLLDFAALPDTNPFATTTAFEFE